MSDHEPPEIARPGPPRALGRGSLLALALALLFFAAPLPWPTNRFDTGISIVAAERILEGELPYADFMILHTPGRYYLVALAFALFGAAMDVYVALGVVLQAGASWLAWHAAYRVGGSRVPAWIAFGGSLGFAYAFPGVLLALGSVFVVARRLRTPTFLTAAACGALPGLTAYFRQDFGLATSVAVAGIVLVRARAGGWPRRIGLAATAGFSSGLVLLLLLAPPLLRSPSDVWEQLLVNPVATLPFRGSESFVSAMLAQGPAHVAVICALAVLATYSVALGVRAVFREPDPTSSGDPVLAAGLGIVGLYALKYYGVRPDQHHLIPAGVALCCLAGVGFGGGRGAWRWAAPVLVALATLVPAWSLFGAKARHLLGRRPVATTSMGDVVPGARAFHVKTDAAADYVTLIRRVQELTEPGEPIFSAASRHDYAHDQDLLLYHATGRPSRVHSDHFDPGVSTREDVQQRIVDDLERLRIRVVVRKFVRPEPDFDPALLGSLLLDEYLAANFAPLERHGRYEIWVRK